MLKFKRINSNLSKKLFTFLLIFLLGAGVGYYLIAPNKITTTRQEEKNTTRAFASEIYDKIKEHYWDNISDAQLIAAFKTSLEKVEPQPITAKLDSKEKLISEMENKLKDKSEEEKKKAIVNIVAAVLSSLNPVGRSGLYTEKHEQQLKNTVENVNPQKDLYKDLGLTKGASEAAIEKAYSQKEEELNKLNTPEAKEQLKQLSYAKDVLTEKDQKQRYDQGGVEPTIFSEVLGSSTLYVQYKKFSPTSYDEFVKAFEQYKDRSELTSLIFDLRGNIGGAIDATPYFLGHFIGKNAYAYEFYKKGEYIPFKTQTEKLPSIDRFKQVVVLIDNQTQSSAEIMAASLKKYRVGVVLGVPTKGWGTVERVFPLDNQIDSSEKYSMFLVHSITLREDNQPIEGRGVEPNINITNPNWQQQFNLYFNSPTLLNAVREILARVD